MMGGTLSHDAGRTLGLCAGEAYLLISGCVQLSGVVELC